MIAKKSTKKMQTKLKVGSVRRRSVYKYILFAIREVRVGHNCANGLPEPIRLQNLQNTARSRTEKKIQRYWLTICKFPDRGLYLPYWSFESTFSCIDLFLERISRDLLCNNSQVANQRWAMAIDAFLSICEVMIVERRSNITLLEKGSRKKSVIVDGPSNGLMVPI